MSVKHRVSFERLIATTDWGQPTIARGLP